MVLLLVLSMVISASVFVTVIYPIAVNIAIMLALIMIAFLSVENGAKTERLMDSLMFSSLLLFLDSMANYAVGNAQTGVFTLAVSVFAFATALTILMLEELSAEF